MFVTNWKLDTYMSVWICSLALSAVSLTPFNNVEFPM